MKDTRNKRETAGRDVTRDLLLCNRCGNCRAVCPVFDVLREEQAGARGKVELAEAFFRGEDVDEREMQRIFDLCLHCMTCEENCPSGMRADEIVMAVRAELARRGRIPRLKRLALGLLGGMDNILFKALRALRITRRGPLHGVGARSAFSPLFPLVGWSRDRSIPLPAARPFLADAAELSRAADANLSATGAVSSGGKDAPGGRDEAAVHDPATADLLARVRTARERNLAEGRRAYFFVGHAVNHFFPEEARAIVCVLNRLGVDVVAPKDQLCCGAPVYYAGDIDGARRAAVAAMERLDGHEYDWIVTSCSTGGTALREDFPRLFDVTGDGYFTVRWDGDAEEFVRDTAPAPSGGRFPREADLWRRTVEGRVRDINELVAELLGYVDDRPDPAAVFEAAAGGGNDEAGATGPKAVDDERGRPGGAESDWRPVVTYHLPCHLNRGQGVDWQPEAILRALPGWRYVAMPDADLCCGGGGAFTVAHAGVSAAIGERKMDSVAMAGPDLVATACPVCRIQLMDMLRRRFVVEAKKRGEEPRAIPVRAPVELLDESLAALPA
ncbi:MAG: (Fe-S)-binding protein [Candidatus Krumholzibacteriota bacterium]|nr:(Fe-S)-binding protein [Candidatus Krumholzibacteriota bacterium]